MREITGNSEVKRVTFTVIQGCQNWYQVRMQFHTNSVGDVATQNPKSAFLRYFYSPQSRLRASFGLLCVIRQWKLHDATFSFPDSYS